MELQTNGDHIPDQIKSLQKKTLVQQLQVRLTSRSTLRMARQLGREPEQMKVCQKTHSPDFQQGWGLQKQVPGCGPFCKKNDTLVLCPSCKLWFWHISCLEQICEKQGIICTTPIGYDFDWKCIHALKSHWEYHSLIWILWDYFSSLLHLVHISFIMKFD